MNVPVGIVMAFIAMFCWGIGDFLMQRSSRKFGTWETIFIITSVGAIVLFPFAYKEIFALIFLSRNTLLLLLLSSVVYLVAGYLDLEALRRGKLAVIEPIYSLEIPVASLAAFLIIREIISSYQIALIIALVIGLTLVSISSKKISRKNWIEKGAIIGAVAASCMGIANFLIGISSRATSVIAAKWFFDVILALASLIVLIHHRKLKKFVKDLAIHKRTMFSMCLLDNVAWLAFGFAMVLAPISIAVALSESYIILAVLLGVVINKEKLSPHQKIGLVVAVVAIVVLASTFG